MVPRPPSSPLFPYTTLFRSARRPSRRSRPPASIASYDAGSSSVRDRKSTRLNSSHRCISYAVFCLKKKKNNALEEELRALGQGPDVDVPLRAGALGQELDRI